MCDQNCLPGWVTERRLESLQGLRLWYTMQMLVTIPLLLATTAILVRIGQTSDTMFLVLLLTSSIWFAHCQHRLWLFRPRGPAAREYNRWQCYCIKNQCYLTPDQWRESRRSYV